MEIKVNNIPDHDTFSQEVEQALKHKFDKIKSQYVEQIKILKNDKAKLLEKNQELETQLEKFQIDVQEAIKQHKNQA